MPTEPIHATKQHRCCVLFVSHRDNNHVLQRQIGDAYKVVWRQTLPDEAAVSLAHICIVDGPALLAHQQFFRARKQRRGAMALPILLLTTQKDTFWRNQNFADIIDETVLMPTDPRLLKARIDALALTKRLHQDNIRLLETRAEHIEALLRERETRSRVVISISHDLRVPLTSTQMAADMMLRDPSVSDKQRKYIERIIRSVERMDQMIFEILDADRLQQGQQNHLHPVLSDLGQMLSQAYDEWHAQYPTRYIPKCFPSTPGHWDTHAIRRALDNLTSNAIKYGDDHSPIVVDCQVTDKDVTFSVCNQGAVIAQEEQSRLFDLFHRTPSAEGSSQKGWGIGLAVVRTIAQAHGGEVYVRSTSEEGTTFFLKVVSLEPASGPRS